LCLIFFFLTVDYLDNLLIDVFYYPIFIMG